GVKNMPSHLELIGTFSTEEIVSTISELAYEPLNWWNLYKYPGQRRDAISERKRARLAWKER
ncbi:MAG TPA: hypothetical protein VGN34_13015, partial [Ktedonobacteraceae bacterium]